jgi:hypothetical protein
MPPANPDGKNDHKPDYILLVCLILQHVSNFPQTCIYNNNKAWELIEFESLEYVVAKNVIMRLEQLEKVIEIN